jgi:hypothetical protein
MHMFGLAGALAVAVAVALWQGVDAYRWRHWRRFWISLAVIPPLSIGVCVAIWTGSQHPTFNFWGNLGLGQDWECENLGRAGAVSCARGSGPPLSDSAPASGN